MKKFLLGIATFITMAILCVVSASAETYGDFEYAVLGDGTVEITDYTGSATELVIPSELDGKKVTSIGSHAFFFRGNLKKVTIPDTVTSIGESAFASCGALTSVTLPGSITNIGEEAFALCTSLETIIIPVSVEKINHNVFHGCTFLKSITIPKSVTSIETDSFSNCTALVMKCYKNSFAHHYAVDNYIKYNLLDAPAAPSAVTGFKSPSKSTTAIRLNWTKNAYADGYVIEKYTSGGWMQIADITDPETVTYKVTGLKSGTAYKFRMRAYNAGGESKNTATLTVSTQMTAVKGFKSPSKSTSAIRLNWTKNAYATGYIIEQYNGSAWVQIADITDPATVTYKVTGLKSGTAYKFRMKAYSVTENGEIIYGNKTATLTANTQASSVTGLALKSRSSTALRLKWTKNTEVDGYIIEQMIDGEWVQIADIDNYATTEYKVTGLSASTKYEFRMKSYAVTKYGDKTYSPYTSVLSKTTNPSTISGLKVKSKAQTAIRLAWNKNTSAKGYLIEQYKDGKWVQVSKIEDNATLNYRIDGLKKATTYKFRVRVYNVVGTTTLYSDYKTVSGTTNS